MSPRDRRAVRSRAGWGPQGHSAKKRDPPLVGPNHEAAKAPTSERSQRPGGTVRSRQLEAFGFTYDGLPVIYSAMGKQAHRVVAAGYDDIADAYLERFGISTIRQKWLERLIESMPAEGGRVLDLGCGAGIPVAQQLVGMGHAVVGVDGSAQQIRIARQNVPQGTFRQADMCDVGFEASSFDAVGAFYSLTHIPSVQQRTVIANIGIWLKPGGKLVASFGVGDAGEWTGEWLGTTMFFGHASEAETLQSLVDAGLRVQHCSVEKQDNEEIAFMWVEAIKHT